MNLHQGQAKYKLPLDCGNVNSVEVERSPQYWGVVREVGPHILLARQKAEPKRQDWPELYAVMGDHIEMFPTPHTTGEFRVVYIPVMKVV